MLVCPKTLAHDSSLSWNHSKFKGVYEGLLCLKSLLPCILSPKIFIV